MTDPRDIGLDIPGDHRGPVVWCDECQNYKCDYCHDGHAAATCPQQHRGDPTDGADVA